MKKIEAKTELNNIRHVLAEGYIGKVRRLAVMIKKFTTRDNDAYITVSDPTGEMDGTIHSLVLETNSISHGAVLILEKISIFSPTPNTHYLNVTKNNVVKVYPANTTYPSTFNKELFVNFDNSSVFSSNYSQKGQNLNAPQQRQT